jgi:twinkle protein
LSGVKNETRYVAKALSKIKKFNRLHRVTTFVVAHPTKMQKEENGDYKVPKLYDISGSANFFNKTDFGLTVYRESDDTVSVHVQKVKFQDILGRCGAVQFNFDRVSSRYLEPGQVPWNVEHLNGVPIKMEIEDEGVPF